MAVDPGLQPTLEAILGDRVTAAVPAREHHGQGEAYPGSFPPDLVAFPATTDEVSRVVAACHQYRAPIVPWGAGTSLEGHVAAVAGGVTIDLSGMNRILRVSADDLDATVEAGVTRSQLAQALRGTGLAFFNDPGADATLGGMAATRASGTTAVRYGTMKDYVLGLTVVLADGRVIRTGGRARKSSAGYDLTRLFVGSEGTLGVMTELTIRLHGIPAAVAAAVVSFDSLEGAVSTASATVQLGVPVARMELLDEVFMEAVARFSGLPYPPRPTLFFEFHGGSAAAVGEDAAAVRELAEANGGGEFRWATDEGERAVLWRARHDAYFAGLALRPGCRALVTDVCVPISSLTRCILETKADAAGAPFPAAVLGHVGDGNFHVGYLLDPTSVAEAALADQLNGRLVDRALAMGGTCTGEHGIGIGKRASLVKEHGDAVGVMRSIKAALDPYGLLNPGKIFLP